MALRPKTSFTCPPSPGWWTGMKEVGGGLCRDADGKFPRTYGYFPLDDAGRQRQRQRRQSVTASKVFVRGLFNFDGLKSLEACSALCIDQLKEMCAGFAFSFQEINPLSFGPKSLIGNCIIYGSTLPKTAENLKSATGKLMAAGAYVQEGNGGSDDLSETIGCNVDNNIHNSYIPNPKLTGTGHLRACAGRQSYTCYAKIKPGA